MTESESESSIDAEEAGNTGTSAETSSATGTTRTGGHDSDDGSSGDGGDRGAEDRPSLAAYVRDAIERGDSEEKLIERVRTSYDREIPYRRVKRLVEAEREHIERSDTAFVVEGHAPRYVAIDDLDYLTDAEFGRVVAYLIGEREGHSEILSAAKPTEDTGDGTVIRWQRAEGTMLAQAIAAEPGRVVDGDLVCRVRERDRTVHETNRETEHDGGSEDGKREGRDPVGTAIVTVADVVPGAARLAVRSGIAIHDRAAVRRWLDEARLTTEPFGSLIEGA